MKCLKKFICTDHTFVVIWYIYFWMNVYIKHIKIAKKNKDVLTVLSG